MNYMPKVLKILGVEVGEGFKVDGLFDSPYYFDEYGVLINCKGKAVQNRLLTILSGGYEIKKLPWKPKEDDEYYIVCENENIVKCRWSSRSTNSFYRYNAGNCFKTKEEITPEIKQLILQEMKGKYEND